MKLLEQELVRVFVKVVMVYKRGGFRWREGDFIIGSEVLKIQLGSCNKVFFIRVTLLLNTRSVNRSGCRCGASPCKWTPESSLPGLCDETETSTLSQHLPHLPCISKHSEPISRTPSSNPAHRWASRLYGLPKVWGVVLWFSFFCLFVFLQAWLANQSPHLTFRGSTTHHY